AEIRKNLGFLGDFFSDFSAGVNAAYIYSDIAGLAPIPRTALDLPPEEIIVDTSLVDRRLQGQPTYTLNVFLNYTKGSFETNLNFNVQGNSIFLSNDPLLQNGSPQAFNIRDLFRQPRPNLGFNVQYSLKDALTFRFSANNLLNPEFATIHDYDPEDLFFENYRAGRKFAFGISYRLIK
ncbi:MAG: hypothetical protein AAFU64_18440, partial [Bacteroidota bacterium]